MKKQSKLILILFVFLLFIMIIQSQFLMGQSLTDYNYKSPCDYQILDESKNFGSNSGSFVMYSMKKDKYYIYNEKKVEKIFS